MSRKIREFDLSDAQTQSQKLRTSWLLSFFSRMNLLELRSFVPKMLKAEIAEQGRRQINWGVEQYKPSWWPVKAKFDNPHSDCRPLSEQV
jgi:hypothetical protein